MSISRGSWINYNCGTLTCQAWAINLSMSGFPANTQMDVACGLSANASGSNATSIVTFKVTTDGSGNASANYPNGTNGYGCALWGSGTPYGILWISSQGAASNTTLVSGTG